VRSADFRSLPDEVDPRTPMRTALQPDHQNVGLLIGAPDAVGRGLGSRGIAACVSTVVFTADRISRVVAGPDVRSVRSIAAFERAGLRWVRDATVTGEPSPEHVMIRTRS
jgi:RimJ/RimL family protein N-acetyltransferase